MFDFSASLIDVTPVSPILLSVGFMRMEKIELLIDVICMCFVLLCSQLKSSSVSVLFVSSVSIIDVTTASLILLPVVFMRIEKGGLLIDVICVLFLLSSRFRSSLVSVLFDFNASLNDIAPVSSILLSVDLMRMEKSGLLIYVICVLFLSSPLRQSLVSVEFDFKAPPNDVVPLSSMLFAVF